MEHLTALLARFWPVAIPFTVFAAVTLACARCAIAEMVVWISAALYTHEADTRRATREEWLANLQYMEPSERVEQAGSLLWLGMKRSPVTFISFVTMVAVPLARAMAVALILIFLPVWGTIYLILPVTFPRSYVWALRKTEAFHLAATHLRIDIAAGRRAAQPISRREFAWMVRRAWWFDMADHPDFRILPRRSHLPELPVELVSHRHTQRS
jgi:hypothetical protein